MKHKPSMSLNELLSVINQAGADKDRQIISMTLDSRDVQPGTLFLACPGFKADGRQYIADAIKRGAAAVLAEAEQFTAEHADIPIIPVAHLQQKIGSLAAHFYRQPSRQLQIFGVTGTNGKTSCTQFIAKLLSKLNKPCGVIGTLGYGLADQALIEHGYTTPDAIATQRILAEMYTQGAHAVAMEVSSHALAQGRVNAVEFYAGIFTNLTRDHLDFHGDMASYALAKRRLFEMPNLRYAIVNLDDPVGQQFATDFARQLQVFGYSVNPAPPKINHVATIAAKQISYTPRGISARLTTPWGKGELQTQLIGKFNLSNLLAVITTLAIQNFPLSDILTQANKLRGVPGRVETFGGGNKPLVVVDYAHTPDALEQVLLALRQHCSGKLWCIFGCGGNRDRGKRSLMGYVAQQHADHIILTDDNPRHEQPQHIVSDIMQGINATASVVIEHDRRRAIAHALACAKADDIVLIAGKGHETYQQIGDEILPFSDAVEVKLILNEGVSN